MAGPGSGKTRTLTHRLKYLVTDASISPSSILTITFTRLAAREMRLRTLSLLHEKAAAISFGTFHSIFFQILKNHYRLNADSIARYSVQSDIIKEFLDSHKVELSDPAHSISGLLSEISLAKTSLKDTETLRVGFLDKELFLEMLKNYKERMKSLNLIDFDDMMLFTRELFLRKPNVLKKWQNIFRFILLDEFQDADPLSFETVRLLAGDEGNLFAVRDDDQSIYGFRGAEPGIMRDFKKYYPNASVYQLAVNYRSRPEIVSAAVKVISANKKRIGKELAWSRDSGGLCELKEWKDRQTELSSLKETLKDRQGSFNEVAILLRTHSLAQYVAEELSLSGIPFRSRERIANIYAEFPGRDILDYCRLAAGDRSRATMYRVMNRPYRMISRNALRSSEYDFSEMEAFHRNDLKALSAVRKLKRDLEMLQGMKPYGAVHYILHGMGYLKYLKDYARQKNSDYEELLERAEEIRHRAKEYRSFGVWFAAIEEYGENLEASLKTDEDAAKEAVTIMTLHGSKGLEYPEVFLMDVNEGVLPYHRAKSEEEVEEERRLFYVGMTRAMEKLHLWWIRDIYGKAQLPSRFLKELMDGEGGR
ncbi:MAG: ATP-dependent helicase [Lachnospiraceae bacterium]|nr:ATP-dependent helicase [Lachnospiraceae bacterium]